MGLNKDYCAWTHAEGGGISARPPPGRTKQFFFLYGGPFCSFFFTGRALCYVFLLMRVFFSSYGGLFATFSLRGEGGGFLLRLPPGVEPFSQCKGPFLLIFSPCGGTFLSSWGILCLYVFFMGMPLPPTIYFAGTCYYVTFIPCSPPSLTAAIMYPTKPTATPVFNLQ